VLERRRRRRAPIEKHRTPAVGADIHERHTRPSRQRLVQPVVEAFAVHTCHRDRSWIVEDQRLERSAPVCGHSPEHVIRVSTVSHLHGSESLLFASALALVMASTTIIAATSPRFAARPGAWRLGAHAALTVTMLMLGVVGATVSPMAMVLASATVLGPATGHQSDQRARPTRGKRAV
jgi:hypothetical protein